jgi:hypothetical protein
MSWPDPARPGEPADSQRPWHWVARHDDGAALPIAWNPHLRQWTEWSGGAMTAAEAAGRFRYLGPALTPEETDSRIADGGAPRGLAGLAASAVPEPPAAMVYRAAAIRNHVLIFAGTLFGTLFIVEKFNLMR